MSDKAALPTTITSALDWAATWTDDRDLIERSMDGAVKAYQRGGGGDVWKFSVGAATFLLEWLMLMKSRETLAYLDAQRALADYFIEPHPLAAPEELQSLRSQVASAERSLYAALQGVAM